MVQVESGVLKFAVLKQCRPSMMFQPKLTPLATGAGTKSISSKRFCPTSAM